MRTGERGYNLIELMVSAAVTSVVVAGALAVAVAFNRFFHAQQGIRASQATARQAVNLLSRQLRMAGYGVEPQYAFQFPASYLAPGGGASLTLPAWSGGYPNQSDRLTFFSRDRQVSHRITAVATFPGVTVDASAAGVHLRSGQLLQLVCPAASAWSYARLTADVDVPAGAGATAALPLASAAGIGSAWPAPVADPCFAASKAGSWAYVFKVDRHDFFVAQVDQGTDLRPYLFEVHDLGAAPAEPLAEDVEAFRVTFLRADGTAFTPNPLAPAPTPGSPKDDPLRLNNSPANIRAVRFGLLTRGRVPDGMAGADDAVIPVFNRPTATSIAVTTPGDSYRRFFLESSAATRNLAGAGVFMPPFTEDAAACASASSYPSDGLNCSGG